MKCRQHRFAILFTLTSTIGSLAAANYTPIALPSTTWNQDVIIEKGATPPPPRLTTASMDTGQTNTAFGWYEQGFAAEAADTGLPAAGSTVVAETLPDHSYTLAPSFTNRNAFLIDNALTNVTVTLTTPTAVGGLSFLTSAGAGAVTLGVTVHFTDGSIETNSFVSQDWFGGTNQAFTARGRVDVASRGLDNVGADNPRLYAADIAVTHASATISRIDLRYISGGGHAAVFAVSGGSATAGFSPIAVSGYTQDMVLEASAPPLPTSLEATTASVDAGIANTGFTFYEQGYNADAALTGLPPAGGTITNAAATDRLYTFASSYETNNALLIDADNPTATLTLTTPSAYSGLSFLTAAGAGAVTIDYTVTHANGITQTGTFVSPDWFNNTPVAFNANGRASVANGALDAVNTGNPRLYGVDVGVMDSTSPIASITLSYNTGTGHAAIFALSGAAGAIAPILDQQPASTNVFAGSTVQFSAQASGTPPLQYQWQKEVNGTFGNVANGGNISGATTTNLNLANVSLSDAGRYQLVVSNAAGTTASQAANLNVLSTATDITAPGDAIESIGGTSPAAEMVANAIDNTTAKYLNFGADNDQVAPFVGPVGLVVTPSMGSSIVTGLRIYTANDAVERDPVDYKLEGSITDTNAFTLIASGALSLPEARNSAGLDVDPLAQANQEVTFANTAGYTIYRLTFNNVKNPTSANSLQIGEIELLGTAGTGSPTPQLTLTRDASGTLTLTSSQPGLLQSTTALAGATTVWQDIGPINGPMTITADGQARFYRVQAQP